jgi:hypothetical protein
LGAAINCQDGLLAQIPPPLCEQCSGAWIARKKQFRIFCGLDIDWTVNDVLSVQLLCVNLRDMSRVISAVAVRLKKKTVD